MICDRSIFSYLKRTKMQDFDQKLSNIFVGYNPELSRREGGHPASTLSHPSLTPALEYVRHFAAFIAMWPYLSVIMPPISKWGH